MVRFRCQHIQHFNCGIKQNICLKCLEDDYKRWACKVKEEKSEYADDKEYDGDWVNNKLQGKGRFKWPDGRVYTGEYVNDKKDGKGQFEWPDGKKYNGDWKNGKQHGIGEYYNPAEKAWKKGLWEGGRRIKWIDQ